MISDEIDVITRETVHQGSDTEDEDLPENEEGDILTEIDVTETVVLGEKSPEVLKSLLLGLPSPVSLFWSMLTSGINLALILMALDLVYRAPLLFEEQDLAFARVGFVSYDSAKILIREPSVSQLPIFVSYRYAGPPLAAAGSGQKAPDTAWKHAVRINELDSDTDYTISLTIPYLRPDTRYQYAVSNNKSGHFHTAPKPGQPPKRNDGAFTFFHTSCIKAHFPYNPLDHPLHIPGFSRLAKWIPKLAPHFMLFLGDFIYVDVPHRFGSDPETYRAEYRRVYGSPDWPSVSKELPWIHVIDDHEIANDWDGNTTGVYAAAADPWQHYHAAANPPPVRTGESYFSFTQGPASFFLLDTRRYRTPETSNKTDPVKSMLGAAQLAALQSWIRTAPTTGVKWKIMVSSVPFTKNWRFGDADTWGGYLAERSSILDAMWESSVAQGVGMVVISGDRHEFAATRLKDPVDGRGGDVVEFSVSPLSMFYLPFTKTYEQRDAEDETIK